MRTENALTRKKQNLKDLQICSTLKNSFVLVNGTYLINQSSTFDWLHQIFSPLLYKKSGFLCVIYPQKCGFTRQIERT